MSSYYNNIPIEEYINIEYANVDTINASTVKTQNLFIDNIKSSEKVITQNLTLDTDNIESLTKATTSPYTSDNNTIPSKGYVDEQYVKKANVVGKKYYVNGYPKGEIFNDYVGNKAEGANSHCEGGDNKATGNYSHSEGYKAEAEGNFSHCEGVYCKTTAHYSHAGGHYTQADQESQTAIGQYNTTNNYNALLSVGNGTSLSARSDAFVVYSTGDVKINSTKSGTTPKLTIGTSKAIIGTTALSSSTQTDDEKIATKYYVDNLFSNIPLYTTYSIRIRMYKDINNYFIFDYDYKGIIIVDDYKLIITGECYVEDFSSLTSLTGFNLIIDYIKYNDVYYYEGIGYGTENPNNLSSSTHNISNGQYATLYLQNTPNIQPKSGRLNIDGSTPVSYIPSTRKWFIFNNSIFYHY